MAGNHRIIFPTFRIAAGAGIAQCQGAVAVTATCQAKIKPLLEVSLIIGAHLQINFSGRLVNGVDNNITAIKSCTDSQHREYSFRLMRYDCAAAAILK